MKEIQLTRGMVAFIDDEDFKIVSAHSWNCIKTDIDGLFYAGTNVGSRNARTVLYMHKLLMGGKLIDHINGNGLDNRRSNLRFCTHAQNCANKNKKSGTSSKYKGVFWYKRDSKWRSFIQKEGKKYFLGNFEKEVDAAIAYNLKAKELFGDFAKLNEVNL